LKSRIASKTQLFEAECESFAQTLIELAPAFDLDLDNCVVDLLTRHYALMLKWSSKINLTTLIKPTEAAQFHYLESLYSSKFIDTRNGSLVDIGSGAGFPGIPLAVFEPNMNVVLIESNTRKSVFLDQAARILGLRNVTVFCGHYQNCPRRDASVLVCRALDRFEEAISDLLSFGQACGQVVFFTGSELATVLEGLDLSTWNCERKQIPLSESRLLVLLSQKCST
jgi:16S rRNA (guanine(527)-N(7))-methyltransferase RsmG